MAIDTYNLKLVREADGLEVDLLPLQGLWTDEQYLALTDQTNHLIEITDGVIEALRMPTDKHQVMLAYLYELMLGYIRPRGGKVLFAPLRIRIRAGKYREPVSSQKKGVPIRQVPMRHRDPGLSPAHQ